MKNCIIMHGREYELLDSRLISSSDIQDPTADGEHEHDYLYEDYTQARIHALKYDGPINSMIYNNTHYFDVQLQEIGRADSYIVVNVLDKEMDTLRIFHIVLDYYI